jgi:hypothetical protein
MLSNMSTRSILNLLTDIVLAPNDLRVPEGFMRRHLAIGAALLLSAWLSSPTLAQLQMQEQTVGSPIGH